MDLMGGLLLTFILATTFLYLILIKPRSNKLPLPPGPPAWPILGNLPQLGSKPHQTLHSMSKVYGPLIHLRFGSVPVIVASSSSLASLFLKTYDANFSSRPFNSFAQILAYGARDIAWAPYGPRWRALRKMYSLHLFTVKALDGSSHVRQEEAAALVAGLAKVGGALVDVGNWLNSCTADTLGRGMVGKRLFGGPSISDHVGGGAGGGENEEVKEFKEMAVELMRLAGEFNLADCVPWLRWVDVGGVRGRMLRIAKRFDAFLEKVIREHEEAGATGGDAEEHKDMLSILIGLKGNEIEGGNLTHEEIKALLAVCG